MKQYFSQAKTILGFAVPISSQYLINMLGAFISMFFIARLGKQELAATALASTTFFAFISIAFGMFSAIGILISHAKSKDNPQLIGEIFQNGFWLSLVASIIIAAIIFHIDKLLLWFHQDPHLVQLTKGYFHYAALFLVTSLALNVIRQFFIGIGKPRIPLIISIITTPITVGLSYMLVLGKFGAPQMGLSGLVCGWGLSGIIGLILLTLILILNKAYKKYALFCQPSIVNFNTCIKIINLGAPIGIQFGAEITAMAVGTYFLGWFGPDALAASQIVSQYVMLAVMIYIGFSEAIAVITSQAYAQNNFNLIKQYCNQAILLLTIMFGLLAIIFIFFPDQLINLYLDSAHIAHGQVVVLGRYFFQIASVTIYVDGVRNLLTGTFRGMHNSKMPMFTGIICIWLIGLPLSYLMGIDFHLGAVGIKLGLNISFILAALYLLYVLYHHSLKPQLVSV